MADIFRKGDDVEVWSNSRGVWITDGVVVEAPQEDCLIDGYSIPKGAVKVSYSAGVKWIMPGDIARHLRKAAPAAAAGACRGKPLPGSTITLPTAGVPGGYPAAGSGASAGGAGLLCKHGCGRPVQPGLTRGMKPFDTCCKKCALNPGAGEHDENCGGAAVCEASPVGGARNAKDWLHDLLDSEGALQAHTGQLFREAGGKDATSLKVDEAWRTIEGALLKPIRETLHVGEGERQEMMQTATTKDRHRFSLHRHRTADLAATGLDQDAFREVCRVLLKRKMDQWFPPKLPAKTLSFVRKRVLKMEDVYEVGEKLGEGSFGVVHSVVHKVSGERRVSKRIAKMKGREGMKIEEIMQEIQSMALLDHPNVIKIYEYFEDGDSITQIMEPCRGGELQDKIDAVFRKKEELMYSEAFICDVMKQTLRALAFMHSERFMHKDLKPQNIMLCERAPEGATSASIKVIDFGLTEIFSKDQKSSDQFGGTLLYMAPEVFRLELTFKSDIWSAGVILYNLITGDYPFMATWPLPRGKDMDWWQREVRRIVEDPNGTYKHHSRLADGTVSDECLDLMKQMFRKDPAARPDAPACLNHAWFRKFEQSPPPLSVGVTQCLEAYAMQPELKKAFFLLIAHQSTAPALQELRAIFTHFDVSNQGALSTETIREVLRKSGMSPLKVERIVFALDRDNSGVVQWTEFIAAALCISVCRNKPLVDAAFYTCDGNADGKISAEDLLSVFAESPVHAVWKEHLPAECAKLAPDRHRGPFTKEHLEKYLGSFMKTSQGDALRAVP